MGDFVKFKKAMQEQLKRMSEHELFVTDISKDAIWTTYLGSFPAGTNEIFRERTEHDCQCCKQFLRAAGNVVAIIDNEKVSMWDIETVEPYQTVADALSTAVTSSSIKDVFLHYDPTVGTDFNHEMKEDNSPIKWEHFYCNLPAKSVHPKLGIATKLSSLRSSKEVFKRGLDEITFEAIETVLELIDQNSLYRGDQYRNEVATFFELKHEYMYFTSEESKDNYAWKVSKEVGPTVRIRNSAIGTLLVDLSEGVSLDRAVASFETKVAPTNYKRNTALITKGMIDKAQKKVQALGIEDALPRRYAVQEDITINNVLFADRGIKEALGGVFDELKKSTSDKVKNLDKVEEVSADMFVHNILPKATGLEVMFENKDINSLVSLIAPVNGEARPILKWDNNFSWSYNGEVTDSIKERVKKAGGSVTGALRCSLSWFNHDDLDIHIVQPNNSHVFHGNRSNLITRCKLDVDMNVGQGGSRNAVENITWPDKYRILEGAYYLYINNYNKRETIDVGFDVEIEYEGKIHSFHYSKALRNKENVTVAKFEYTKEGGIKFIESLPAITASKTVWGVLTQKFHKVSMVMNSPNYWDGQGNGNKHLFFMLDGCKNDKKTRGLYNEFLRNDLHEHRKVFEVLGSKMKVEESDQQLSGLGFSSTGKGSALCKVSGSFNRTIKINF